MRRLLVAWLLSLPLIAVGTQFAHWSAYRLAEPHAAERANVLADTGHGYLAALPVLISASLGLLVATLLLTAAGGFRGQVRPRIARWPYVVLPLLGFLSQELGERAIAGVPVSAATLVQTPVLLGLLIQGPFAAAAYALARVLTRAAVELGRALAQPPGRVRALRRAVRPQATALRYPGGRGVVSCAPRGPPYLPLQAA